MRELPEPIPASDLRVGDEIELYKGDPIEPLIRMPNHPPVWWTIVELMEGGYIQVEGIGGIYHHEDTVIAVGIREITREELGLDHFGFRDLLMRMGLDKESKTFRLTHRMRFIKHHTLKVRREEYKREDPRLKYSA